MYPPRKDTELKSPKAPDKKISDAVREFYDNQEKFYTSMAATAKAFEPLLAHLKENSPEDAVWLEYYLKPFRELRANPFQDPGAESALNIQLDGIFNAMVDSQEEANAVSVSPLLQRDVNAMFSGIYNFNSFNKFLQKLKDSPKIKARKDLSDLIHEQQSKELIKIVQHSPRYQLTLVEIIKNIDEKYRANLGDAKADEYLAKARQVLDAIKAEVMRNNTQLKSVENSGSTYLLEGVPKPEGAKVAEYFANLAAQDNNLVGMSAAYLRVKDTDGDKLYYLNKDKNESLLVVGSAKKAEAAGLFTEIDRALPQAPEGALRVRRELPPELRAHIQKLSGHKQPDRGDALEQEVLRRYRHSRTDFMSQDELREMISTINEYLSSSRHDLRYQRFTDLVAQLKTHQNAELSDEQRMQRVREVIIRPYLDIYLEERARGYIYGTVKGAGLSLLENIFQKYDLMEIGDMDAKADKLDARILKAFDAMPNKLEDAVRHLFLRAMAEGLGGPSNKMIYVNARKSINRMGDKAIGLWNGLLQEKFGAEIPAQLLMERGKMESETKDIGPNYDKLAGDKDLKARVNKLFSIEILAASFRENGDNREIISQLETIARKRDGREAEEKNIPALVHQAVMEYFVKAHLAESGVGLFGASKTNLKQMINALRVYHQRSGSELFGNFKDKSSDSQLDKAILQSVAEYKDESQEFARQIFDHALNLGFSGLDAKVTNAEVMEAKKRALYVKDVLTVIEMGEPAIKAWNALALQFKNPKVWADLIIQGSNRQGERFDKLHTTLARNKDFQREILMREHPMPAHEAKANVENRSSPPN